MVREKETEIQTTREREGRPVVGKAALLRTDPLSKPETEKKSTPMPHCHASTKESRKNFIDDVLKPFWEAYKEASAQFLAGLLTVEFPFGSIPPPLVNVRILASP